MEFHPLSEDYPLMPAYELGRMEEGMRQGGFDKRFPIVLFEKKILDGRNRYLAAEKAGVKPQFVRFEGTHEEARLFVQKANEERRHLAPDWLARRRQERVERVAKAREEGQSTRAIAEQEGVSQPQIRRDLHKATQVRPPVSPENQFEHAKCGDVAGDVGNSGGPNVSEVPGAQAGPEVTGGLQRKVTGRDGKQYGAANPNKGAAKPKKAPPKQAAPDPPEDAPDPVRDGYGNEIPEHLAEVFAARLILKDCLKLGRQLAKKIDELANHPGGAFYRATLEHKGEEGDLRHSCKLLRQSLDAVKQHAPHSAVCPRCHDTHPGAVAPDCPLCKGAGWLTRHALRFAERSHREAVERMGKGASA